MSLLSKDQERQLREDAVSLALGRTPTSGPMARWIEDGTGGAAGGGASVCLIYNRLAGDAETMAALHAADSMEQEHISIVNDMESSHSATVSSRDLTIRDMRELLADCGVYIRGSVTFEKVTSIVIEANRLNERINKFLPKLAEPQKRAPYKGMCQGCRFPGEAHKANCSHLTK